MFLNSKNQHRFSPAEHFGLTPMEVLNGEKPFRGRFVKQVQEARENRTAINKALADCPLICKG